MNNTMPVKLQNKTGFFFLRRVSKTAKPISMVIANVSNNIGGTV
jgi:hypothetical protein